jgi:glyoxylase-like metal-dependent hydrolase (beta-lactamase superfamily II)
VDELADGAVVPAGDRPIRVTWTPGPASEHLAFILGEADTAVAIAGDLDGRRGARSIPGPVDDVAAAGSRARLEAIVPQSRWLTAHPG